MTKVALLVNFAGRHLPCEAFLWDLRSGASVNSPGYQAAPDRTFGRAL
jgi:hypothetical protein